MARRTTKGTTKKTSDEKAKETKSTKATADENVKETKATKATVDTDNEKSKASKKPAPEKVKEPNVAIQYLDQFVKNASIGSYDKGIHSLNFFAKYIIKETKVDVFNEAGKMILNNSMMFRPELVFRFIESIPVRDRRIMEPVLVVLRMIASGPVDSPINIQAFNEIGASKEFISWITSKLKKAK